MELFIWKCLSGQETAVTLSTYTMKTSPFISELLAPAGNMDKLRTCLLYGADAVYLGGKSGNLRAACEGFGPSELCLAVKLAESAGAKVYYCINSLAKERDLPQLPAQIENALEAGVHGFIIADPGVLNLARRYAPEVPVHLSTQANTCNSASVAFWADQGVSRVNLARELSCRDIYAIKKTHPEVELEVFVHGAMCLAVSGQCLLSAWLNNRSGNQGRCTQPCRFEYRGMRLEQTEEASPSQSFSNSLVVEEYTRPGEELWRVEQGEDFSSFWAPQDLCLFPWLPWFVGNRIDALKIEGRMKSAGWIAHVVDTYRVRLDNLAGVASGTPPSIMKSAWKNADTVFTNTTKRELSSYMKELLFCATRPLGSGFFLHGKRRNLTEECIYAGNLSSRPNRSGESVLPQLGHQILGRILEPVSLGVWLVEAQGNWKRSMDVELMLPGLRRPQLVGETYGLENQRGELTGCLGNGTRGLLYADNEEIVPGIFVRSL